MIRAHLIRVAGGAVRSALSAVVRRSRQGGNLHAFLSHSGLDVAALRERRTPTV